jgi:hypothetical protein
MGNYLMAFGALIIFSVFSLITNKSLINNKKVAMQSDYIITATSLAQSVIEEAKIKAFDEKTKADTVTLTSSLTIPASLGPETGETFSPSTDVMDAVKNSFKSSLFYDDVDDYNGYKRVVNNPLSGIDSVKVQVYYVNSSYDSTGTRTWYKKMTVTVTSPYISIPVVQSYIFSYYK